MDLKTNASILETLNESQQEAARHIDGPMLILAGPGSGKTRVVTHRIAHMIREGISPFSILALTFTNKAAEEMQQRLTALSPESRVTACTFHRFCGKLLRRFAPHVGLKENYSIYDMDDAKRLLKKTLKENNIELFHYTPDQIFNKISWSKNEFVSHDEFQPRPGHPLDAVVAQIYPLYQKGLLSNNAVDFDDMLMYIAKLLQHSQEIREVLDERYKYICVDEYQDTNLAQYRIVRLLSVNNPNLAVTGDPDQSIYGWRGANIANILEFENDFPNVKVVRLEKNYRSTKRILAVADELISKNVHRKQKSLFTDNEEGKPVRLILYPNQHDEAFQICEQIYQKIHEGASPKDFAIFYRVNSLSRSMEVALRAHGIPYQIVRGHEFFQRKEVKDVLAYLQLLVNSENEVAFERIINVPARKIGRVTLERIRVHARRFGISMFESACEVRLNESISNAARGNVLKFVEIFEQLQKFVHDPSEAVIGQVLNLTKYREVLLAGGTEDDLNRVANLDELLNAAREFDEENPDLGIEGFLEQACLVSDIDGWEESDERVTLMSLHAAKGLEFPYVYLIAFEEGILPHSRSVNELKQLEEERRLAFVGITRAKSELQISLAARRMQRGSMSYAVPSQFVGELPKDLMDVVMPSIQYEPEFEPVSHQARLKNSPAFSEFEEPDIDIHADNSVNSSSNAEPTENQDAGPALEEFEQELSESSDSQIEHEENDPLAQEELERAEQEKKAEQASVRAAIAAKITTASQLYSPKNNGPIEQTEVFQVGMLVSHPEQGAGKIASLSGSGKRRVASIEFFNGEQRKYTLAFSKLTPIRAEDS